MKYKRSVLILLIFLLCYQTCLKAQHRYLLPGVTEDIITVIQTQLNMNVGDNYRVIMVLNVDSSLGGGLGPRWPDVGAIENPYGTLTHCLVFNATRMAQVAPADSASGVVGVFKDGRILWHSDGILTVEEPGMIPNTIWTVKDINRDGKVDILTTWMSLSSGSNPPMFLWIFSWDGFQGTVINARDEYKQSVLMVDSYGDFSLVDVEGDGIWEIQGPVTSYEGDSTRTAIRTFSWNGSLYGLWSNTPQPQEGAIYPKDKVQLTVNMRNVQVNQKFQYSYFIQSSPSSLQDIQEFALDRLTDSVVFAQPRRLWIASLPWPRVISWYCDGLYGFNYILPGENSSEFAFTTVDTTLPRIIKFYAQGVNGEPSDDIMTNSLYGLTVGPSKPPSPFVPLDFLDTLTNYITQSRSLGWIKDQAIGNKYLGYFSSAKASLQQNNIASTRATLQQVLQDANVDSTANITSEAYALIRYNTEYLLGQLPTPVSGCNVKLINSAGTKLIGGLLQYYEGGWKDAVNNNDGTLFVNTTATTTSLRMTYEYGTQTKSNVTVGPDTVVFQTVDAQIQLQDSKGSLIDTGTVQYYAGAWRSLGTTLGGIASKELLPGSYSFRMTYAYASKDKQQDIGTNPTVVFQTVNAAVQLQNSQGTLMPAPSGDQGTVQYYSGAWRDFGVTVNGVATKELLPNNYSFRMSYSFASKDKQQDIGANPTVVFQTVNATVQLQNSQGSLMPAPLGDQGTVQYYAGAWRDFGVTAGGAVAKELLPNTYSFRMTYAYASKDKQQDVGVNPTVVFQTVNATVQLQNSQGGLIDQGTVQYYAGAWRDFGNTTGGVANKELLPNNYSFRMTYAYASKDKQQDVGVNPTVVFQTVNASVQLENSQGSLMPAPLGDQGTVQYYAGAWRGFGNTTGGVANKELLPNNYSFRMTYEYVSLDKTQDLSTNSTVSFSTVLCTIRVKNSQSQPVDGATASYYSGAWRQIGTTVNGEVTKELLPVNLTFRVNYGTQQQDKAQNLSINNIVDFSIQP
jgi:hypothetical protein